MDGEWRVAKSKGAFRIFALVFGVYLLMELLIVFVLYRRQHTDEPPTKPSYSGSCVKTRGVPRLMDDGMVTITIKTTLANHEKRLRPILDTWYQQAKEDIYIVTDGRDDSQFVEPSHLLVTKCGAGHHSHKLVCKMQAEFDVYYERDTSWFCHFDDDNYVNIQQLKRLLVSLDSDESIYLGKISLAKPMTIKYRGNTVSFQFATGGAGICISQSIMTQLRQLSNSGTTLAAVSAEIGLPDDVTVGFIIEHLLNTPLTVENNFHSHLENMHQFTAKNIGLPVSLSGHLGGGWVNTVRIPPRNCNISDDFRFFSIHCTLYPSLCNEDSPSSYAHSCTCHDY